MNALKYAFQFS